MAIEIGLQGHSETLVEQEDTAKSVGSGDLLVYATPCMAALMEGAACESIDEAGEIGHAQHERVIVKAERFLEKTYDKL